MFYILQIRNELMYVAKPVNPHRALHLMFRSLPVSESLIFINDHSR